MGRASALVTKLVAIPPNTYIEWPSNDLQDHDIEQDHGTPNMCYQRLRVKLHYWFAIRPTIFELQATLWQVHRITQNDIEHDKLIY